MPSRSPVPRCSRRFPRPRVRPLLRAGPVTGSTATPPSGVATSSSPAPPARSASSALPPIPPVAVLSYTSLQQHASCGYRFYLERVLRIPPTDETHIGASARPAAELDPRVRGRLVHSLLEQLDFVRAQPPDAASRRRRGRAGGGAAAGRRGRGDRAAGRGLSRERAARAARVAHRPPPRAAVRAAPDESAGRGRSRSSACFDAIGREGERTVVVDYKSDRLAPGRRSRRSRDRARLRASAQRLRARGAARRRGGGRGRPLLPRTSARAGERDIPSAGRAATRRRAAAPRRRGPPARLPRRARPRPAHLRRLPRPRLALLVAARSHARGARRAACSERPPPTRPAPRRSACARGHEPVAQHR